MEFENQNDGFDLDWQAFCYVADEMNEAQVAEFEKILADNPAAREAVERAMSLAAAVHEVDCNSVNDAMVKPVVGQPEKVSPAFFVFAAATLLAMLLGATVWWLDRDETSSVASNSEVIASDSLAEAWGDSFESDLAMDQVDEQEADDLNSVESLVNDETADWMLAALIEMDSETVREN